MKRIKKYIVLLLTIAIYLSGMAVAPLAVTVAAEPDSTSVVDDSSKDDSSTGGDQDDGITGGNHGLQIEHENPKVPQIMLSFNLDGGSGLQNSYVDKGTKIYELKKPVRKGYKFAGWIVNGKKVSGSYQMNTDTFLTATWEKEDVSSEAESEVESGIAAEVSSGTESSEIAAAVSEASSETSSAVSSQAPSSTRFSILFYIGILLVVIGVGGLVFLIVRQFRNKGGKGGPKSSGGHRNEGFTDISSYSDGRKIYKHIAPSEEEPTQPVRSATKPAYATGRSGNFDWQKFFDEENF
jgi:hypothetical protein